MCELAVMIVYVSLVGVDLRLAAGQRARSNTEQKCLQTQRVSLKGNLIRGLLTPKCFQLCRVTIMSVDRNQTMVASVSLSLCGQTAHGNNTPG